MGACEWLGCLLAAPHSWGHLEALGKGNGVAGLPACVLLAGQTPPTTGTCSHTQICSPLSSPTPVPRNTRHHWSAAPYPGAHSHPTLSLHMSFQTHTHTHHEDTSYSSSPRKGDGGGTWHFARESTSPLCPVHICPVGISCPSSLGTCSSLLSVHRVQLRLSPPASQARQSRDQPPSGTGPSLANGNPGLEPSRRWPSLDCTGGLRIQSCVE